MQNVSVEPSKLCVAVVDDEPGILNAWKRVLSAEDMHVVTFAEPGRAQSFFDSHRVDVALIDLHMPKIGGLDVLRYLRRVQPEAQAIMMSGVGTVPAAVESMQLGATEFLSKPFQNMRALARKVHASAHRSANSAAHDEGHASPQLPNPAHAANDEVAGDQGQSRDPITDVAEGPFIGSSPAVDTLRREITALAAVDKTTLIEGETGTGKELIARMLHAQSVRAGAAFVSVNCVGRDAAQLNRVLFGTVEPDPRRGSPHPSSALGMAAGGTLYLNNIDEMPLQTQVLLNRYIDRFDRPPQTRRLRATESVLSARIIASTPYPLVRAVRQGKFRWALRTIFGRHSVTAPLLKDRMDDVPAIAEHILTQLAQDADPPVMGLSGPTVKALCAHSWPGNVRELHNALEFASISCAGSTIELSDLPPWLRRA